MHGLMSMIYLDVLDLDYIIAVIGLNDQMNSKKLNMKSSEAMIFAVMNAIFTIA